MFQFINSYTALYYIAFLKRGNHFWFSSNAALRDVCKVGDPNPDVIGRGCIDELMIQLSTLLITNITIGQTREVLIPYAIGKLKAFLFAKKQGLESDEQKKMLQFEREAFLVDYPGTFDEYNEMVLQYGFVTLFAAAFPFAPLLAVINNQIEIRTDAFKTLTAYNRPPARGAQDIGTWYMILEVFGVLAVVTNCAMIAFSYAPVRAAFDAGMTISSVGGEWQINFAVFATIVALEHFLILAKFLLSVAIPDMPGYVRKAMSKSEFIKAETFKHLNKASIKKWDDAPKDKDLPAKDDEL
jgi:hypothetical protein